MTANTYYIKVNYLSFFPPVTLDTVSKSYTETIMKLSTAIFRSSEENVYENMRDNEVFFFNDLKLCDGSVRTVSRHLI